MANHFALDNPRVYKLVLDAVRPNRSIRRTTRYNILNTLMLKNLKVFLILPSTLSALDTRASTCLLFFPSL
ncbi:hypothetical protein BpHYR1_049033 [Brachionus plicatilis]|uniref:Uncharacterized protein n=1 Tax=Brachionus plicatilis TaxID=10195 RepID=A0A3M7S615_BRAPC|nr:hypothetical protein BpHYR1_049033 [Brachionus plicatilis]